MNKRVWMSFFFLLIAVVLSLTSFLILQERFFALSDTLEDAIYSDVPLRDSCRKIEASWDRCAGVAQAFLLHSDLCELRTAVTSLPDLIEEPVVFRNACIRSLHLLEGILDSLYPTADNIL